MGCFLFFALQKTETIKKKVKVTNKRGRCYPVSHSGYGSTLLTSETVKNACRIVFIFHKKLHVFQQV